MSRKVFIFKNSGPAHSPSIDFKQLVIHVVQQLHSQGVTYDSWADSETPTQPDFDITVELYFFPDVRSQHCYAHSTSNKSQTYLEHSIIFITASVDSVSGGL